MEDELTSEGSDFRARLRGRVTNLLAWSYVDKAMFVAAVTFPFPLIMAVYAQYAYHHREFAPFVNWDYMPTIVRMASLSAAGWVLFLGAGLWLRRHHPNSRAYVHVLHALWYLGTVYMIYCFGLPTSPAAVQILGGAIAGVLFFDLRCVLPTLGTVVVALIVMIGLERADLIPYAPLLLDQPFIDGRVSNAWLVMQVSMFFVISGLIFAVAADLVVRTRKREAQVQELNSFLRRTFGRYLSSEVLRALIANPEAMELGGQKRTVSIMMTDIRGFTQLSEKLEPEQIMTLINRYLAVMTDICDKHHGTVNDIAGDGLLVTFGAPLPRDDHAHAAVACAIDMQNAVENVNKLNIAEGLPPIEVGIGLNTAEVVVGNIGSEKRSKYGVVGSGVNITSRIESYAVGGQILASRSLIQEAGSLLRIDSAMEVFPKGAEMPLMVYAVGGISGHYNVLLEQKADGLVRPLKPVNFSYVTVSEKQIGSEILRASVLRISRSSALLSNGATLAPHDDLKLNLEGVKMEFARLNFYAKVISTEGLDPQNTTIRFTSLPPEISAYFEGLISTS